MDNLTKIAGAIHRHAGGALIFTIQYILTYKFYTKPWPRINGLCRKKEQSIVKTGARAASAGPCCSCQQDSLYNSRRSWRTWNEQGGGQSKMNGASEHGQWAWHGKGEQAHKARRTRPLQANKAGGRSARHRPQRNNSQQLAGRTGLAAKQRPPMKLAGLSPCSAGWWRECGGAGHSKGGLGPTYLSPSHLSPLPVTVPTHSLNLEKPNLAPTFFFPFLFYLPLEIRPLTPFTVCVRLTYPVT